MGKVLQFPSSSTPRVNERLLPPPPTFEETLGSAESVERVGEAIADAFKLLRFAIESPPRIGLMGDLRQGTVHEIIDRTQLKNNRMVGVVTSHGFPTALEEFGFSQEEAVEFAADFTLLYGIAYRGLLRHSVVQKHVKSFETELWYPEFQSPARALPYRIAGGLALSIHGMRPLGTAVNEPFLPHLAGLHNPLAPDSLSGFHPVMIKGSAE